MTPAEENVEVVRLTDDEVRQIVQERLDELGLTPDELREQARTDFESREAKELWMFFGDCLDLVE